MLEQVIGLILVLENQEEVLSKMNYKDTIKHYMEELAKDENVRFLGYNIAYGSKAYGTLANIASEKCIETPLAENLMTGLAIGMAIEGFKPVLFYERHDFLFNGLDAIVNHIDKFEELSHGLYKAPVLIRATVGSTQPLDPGIQHKQDLTEVLKMMVNFPVYELNSVQDIHESYKKAMQFNEPCIIIEHKNRYDKND